MSNLKLNQWIQRLIPPKIVKQLQSNPLKRSLMVAVSGTIGLRVANAGLTFMTSVILTRLLGASSYGSYAYALSWIRLAQIPAELGLGAVTLREISIYLAKSEWQLARGLLSWVTKSVFLASTIVAILTGLLIWGLDIASASINLITIVLALISLPLRTLLKMRESALKAFNRIVLAQLPQQLFQPVLLLIILGIVYATIGPRISDVEVMSISIFTFLVALLMGTWLYNLYLPNQIRANTSSYNVRIWLASSLPFIFTAGMSIVNTETDSLMLGSMQGAESVGIYTVANRCTQLITFILIAVNSSIAPTFATLYAQGNLQKLQSIVTKSCRLILLSSLPLSMILIFFGHWFLLIFGSEFVAGHSALIFLSIGKLVNATTGSVALLLNMTGNERDTALGVAISALLNAVLNFLLIPHFGIQGAAVATATSTVVWNIILSFFVYKRLKIYPTAFIRLRHSAND